MKNGFKYHKQRYLCKSCGKQFVFCQKIDNQELYTDYVFGKQTLKQLSIKYKITIRTVQRKLSIIDYNTNALHNFQKAAKVE